MKIQRDAFGYLAPRGLNTEQFSQCGQCFLYLPLRQRCAILGDGIQVLAQDACAYFLPGTPTDGQRCEALITPIEAGYVQRQVRCENCAFGNGDEKVCELYRRLNNELPEIFDLDEGIDPKGCCNAQVPPDAAPDALDEMINRFMELGYVNL